MYSQKYLSLCKSLSDIYILKTMTASSHPLNLWRPINNYIQYSTFHHNVASYEEVKEISVSKKNKILLIDVREPEELSESGVIPSSINIPLGHLESILKCMSNEEFLKKYGKVKPDRNSSIIFSCKLGKRSATACDIAKKLGFKIVKNYEGGWIDWKKRNNGK